MIMKTTNKMKANKIMKTNSKKKAMTNRIPIASGKRSRNHRNVSNYT